MKTKRNAIIFVTAIFLGLLAASQAKSLIKAQNEAPRESDINFFKEIRILKDKNDDLRKEINELKESLNKLSDKNQALKAIEDEINRYKKLTGDYPISGAGITLTIQTTIPTIWLTDMINELFNAGAQAVDINNIRLSNQILGFDTLPQGQISLNGEILEQPYMIRAIGNSKNLYDILTLPGGIITRLKAALPKTDVGIKKEASIEMN